MAFHPYPRVIPSVFNRSGFGPPRGLTPASACPWVAHPASRPRRATDSPRGDSPSLRLASKLNLAARRDSLAHSTKGTPSHRGMGAPTARGRTVSGAVSLPSRGAFHLSLTVLVHYRSQESAQPWRVVPPASDRVSRVRPYSGTGMRGGAGFAYGAVALFGRPFHAVPLPAPFVTAPPRARRESAGPTTPGRQRLAAYTRPGLGSSAFARRYSRSLA